MMGKMKILSKLAIAVAMVIASMAACADPFTPAKIPQAPSRAKLEVAPGGLSFVKCELNGKPCTLIFDTGATHTTFDIGFVKREFPDMEFRDLVMGGEATTNVGQQTKIFEVESFKVGEAEFGGFTAMALDMGAFGVDGILGFNVIGSTRIVISFGSGEVSFGLPIEARKGFSAPARRILNPLEPTTVTLSADCGKGPFALFIDSGSTWTFLQRDCGWPATTNELAFTAHDINGAGMLQPVVGEKGILRLSPACEIEVAPLLSQEPLNRIGSDVLQKYDILIEPRAVAFRKAKTENETHAE